MVEPSWSSSTRHCNSEICICWNMITITSTMITPHMGASLAFKRARNLDASPDGLFIIDDPRVVIQVMVIWSLQSLTTSEKRGRGNDLFSKLHKGYE